VGIAITRYRLYEIDRIINRTLVYGSLTVTLIALYFGVIVVTQRAFVLLTSERSTLAVVASTLLIAALFTPLRRLIQGFIDRPLLSQQVRREEGPGSALGPVAKRNGPGGIERRPGRGGKRDYAASPRLAVAAPRNGLERPARRITTPQSRCPGIFGSPILREPGPKGTARACLLASMRDL
jgi:hypothetical protein